jgi:hypothetical protein
MPEAYQKSELCLKVQMQTQDLQDHGEAMKKQDFTRIDAEPKDEDDKQLGVCGKVCPLSIDGLREHTENHYNPSDHRVFCHRPIFGQEPLTNFLNPRVV